MASRLASQLQALAKTRKSSAPNSSRQKPSFLFECHVAGRFDNETIFTNATGAFNQLIDIDGRFRAFAQVLFRPGSWQFDIDVIPQDDVSRLLTQVEKMLTLLSSSFLLTPTHNVIEYLVRQYRVHERCRDAFMCMAIPYFGSPLFHRIVSLVNLSDQWVFLKPSFEQGEGYAKSTLVNHACDNAAFFQIVLEIASRSADLARTGSSNHAAVAFTSSIILAVIDRKAISESHLRFLLPFLQKALNRRKTVCVELRALAQSVAVAVCSFLSCSAVNALVTSILTSVDTEVNIEELQTLLECASLIFKCRRPDWAMPEKALAHVASIRSLPEALANVRASPGVSDFVDATITFLIKSGNLSLATCLITNVTDVSVDSTQHFIDLAVKWSQDVDQFRRDLGFHVYDEFRHPNAENRLSAFKSLEDQVTSSSVTIGSASAVYYDCLNDDSETVVCAVLRSPTTVNVVDPGSLCTAIRRALKRFDSADNLVNSAIVSLCKSNRDEFALLLVDLALSHCGVLKEMKSIAVHPLFQHINHGSLHQTIANGTTSETLLFVLDLLKTRPVLLPAVTLISSEIVSGSVSSFIETLDILGALPDVPSIEFDQACKSVAKATNNIADHHQLFAFASKFGADETLKFIVNARRDANMAFLSSIWEDSKSSVPMIVSALGALSQCLSKRENLSYLIPHILTVICHEDASVRKSALQALSHIKKCCRPKLSPKEGNLLTEKGFFKVNLVPLLEKVIASSNEILIDRFWMRKIPLQSSELEALVRSCDVLLTDDARVSLLSNIHISSLDISLVEELSKFINERTCCSIASKIVSLLNNADAGKFLNDLLQSNQPSTVIEVALSLFSPMHYESFSLENRRSIILRLSELMISDLAQSAFDLLTKIKVSGEIASFALLNASCAPRKVSLLKAWSHPGSIEDPAPFVGALFSMLKSPCDDPTITVDVLKALLNIDDVSSYVSKGNFGCQHFVQTASASRDACAFTIDLISMLASDGVESAFDHMVPVLSKALTFLSKDDTYLSKVIGNALQVLVPVCNDSKGLFLLFLDSWSSIPGQFAGSFFRYLIPEVNPLGVCVVHLVAKYGVESFSFCHSLFNSFPIDEQISGLASIVEVYSSTHSTKRRRYVSEQMPPALSFTALHLDQSSFVFKLSNSSACNNAFATLYRAVLSEPESPWLDSIVKNIVAVASLPSFVSHLGTLMHSTNKDNQTLRRRTLQLLNDKLETLCESGRKVDDVAPVIDTLMPDLLSIVGMDNEPDVNRQLSLLVIDALSAICPDDVIAPFVGAVPEILETIPSSSTELQSCVLMTLGSLVARLGPHALKFLSATMTVLLRNVELFQSVALSAICVIISSLPKFMAPYMQDIFQAIVSPAVSACVVTELVFKRLQSGVPCRVLVTALTQFDNVHERLLELLNSVVTDRLVPAEVKSHNRLIFQFCLKAFDTGNPSVAVKTVAVFTSLAVRLNEKQLSSLYASLLEWAGPFSERSQTRHANLFSILNSLLDCLETLAVPYIHQVVDLLTCALSSKEATMNLSCLAFDILRKACQHDDGNFVSKQRFDAVLAATINRIKISFPIQSLQESKKLENEHLAPFVAELAAVVDHEMYWKPLSYELLQLTRNSNPSIRHAAFVCLHDMMKRVGEPLLVILPEMMPFISEALEDDDPEVEFAVRNMLSLLEQVSGENMEEYLK